MAEKVWAWTGSGWSSTIPPDSGGAGTGEVAALTAQIAALSAAIEQSPVFKGTVNGVYQGGRPKGQRPVVFVDPNVQPGNDGSTAGGGGMVPEGTLPGGLTDLWLS